MSYDRDKMMPDWINLPAAFSFLSRLKGDRTASVALIFATSLVVVVPAIGVAVDVGRAVHFKTALQSAADDAALAGATVFKQSNSTSTTVAATTAKNFMNQAIAALPPNTSITAANASVQGSSTTSYTVNVTATRGVATTFLSPVMKTMSISVSATAKVTFYPGVPASGSSTSGNLAPVVASSDAGDNNILYMYAIPADGSIPKPSDLVMIYNNDPAQAANNPKTPPAVALTSPNQKIGFALMNKTGALHPYGSNAEGAPQGSVHWMYSHLNPPSKLAYPSATQDCSLETADMTNSKTPTAAAPSTGKCFSTTPGQYTQNFQLDCTKNAGKIIRYYWNDMGGTTDDRDYNDAAYSVSCPASTTGSGSGATIVAGPVVLIK